MSRRKKPNPHYTEHATEIEIDFSRVPNLRYLPSGIRHDETKPMNADGKVLTEKQIRARIRRRMKKHEGASADELAYLYPHKPVEDWDLEELARGKPRNRNGTFTGRKPTWVTREIHEQAMERYKRMVKDEMSSITVRALEFMADAVVNTDVDDKGKPLVPATVKADLSKFLVEHVVGKPMQRIEQDVSVKLQSILGTVMVNPEDSRAGLTPAHFPGVTMKMYEDGDDIEDAEVVDG